MIITENNSPKVIQEQILLGDHEEDNSLTGLGQPASSHPCSQEDGVAVAVSDGLNYRHAGGIRASICIHWGQTRQFIWVGLCLTVMAWCAQFPLRRLFLISSTNSGASTLQSPDAILRFDPTVPLADWRIRVLLALMLALGPALSVAYKALGGGQSHFIHHAATFQLGVTGPPGTQNLGFGLSLFTNATLPWFKDPGFPDRVHSFNMHVANENVTAMLDGPMPSNVNNIQTSLKPEQSTSITADVTALVCEQNDQLSPSGDMHL